MQQQEILELLKVKFPLVSQEEATKAIIIPKDLLLDICGYLKNTEGLSFDNLHCITAIDWKERIDLVYILCSIGKCHSITLKINLALDSLGVMSLTGLWKSADWFEREVYDLFGVKFSNHPDLRRILNPDDWQGYPLRKDYSRPDFIKKPQF